jgi:hypothetical protein
MANTKPFKINSIALPLVGKDYLSDSPAYLPVAELLADIRTLGATDARLLTATGVLAKHTDNSYDASLLANIVPPDASVLAFAGQLKAQGLTLTWFPFLLVNQQITGSGTGSDKAAPTNFDTWIQTHKTALVHQARLAQQAGAERFVIFADEVQHLLYGSAATPGRTAQWLDVVRAVREVYKGEITTTLYVDGTVFPGGSNHVQLIPREIIDAVDTIGVGLFTDPLTSGNAPSVTQLTQAWYSNAKGVNSVALLKGISDFYGKKVWVGDRAFHSFDGANTDHGVIFRPDVPVTVDMQEQADLYESFLRVTSLEQGDWFNGISFQNLNRIRDFDPFIARFLDSVVGENIQGKLAFDVLADWFNGRKQGAGLDLTGTAAADKLQGGYHNDMLRGLGGDDALSGGAGIDTAVFTGQRSAYTITRTSSGFSVTSSAEGTDTLLDLERLKFSDGYVALDSVGNGGMAYRLYQAAFNRTPDSAGLGYQINALDTGLSISQVAANFIASPEFKATYGALDTTQFVTQLYANVLHRVADSGGLAYHAANINSGMSRADVLVGFSESPENQAALIGAIQNGMVYTF